MTNNNMRIQCTTCKGLFQSRDRKILIVKSTRDEYWELPGGKIEFNEQPEETLKREFREELGIAEFEIKKLEGAFSFWASDEEGDWQFLVLVYLCSLKNEDLRLSAEHEEFKWISPDQIRSLPMREGYYKIIEAK